jgi:hypothetical protein
MESELVESHGESLETKGQKPEGRPVHPVFRRMAPAIVNPGPKARETIKVPGWTVSSSRIDFHTWGRVAEDMLP